MPPKAPLTPDQRRLRVIIFSFPVLVASTYVLYRRMVLGEEQRQLPKQGKLIPPPT
ncbi:hypothetical protein K437DRAFT_232726 [Tilletiaria anomala UBC 951]|uniref:Uncharacterized protein n=1 Tax=Tilletiaria anomala (strain ATCC 24038 / CBS 436.72 / UBC 951) TaxID=1037660 RepID=A0A066WNC6_TILAU|nr:uncharacterized protein K437DRAFT_232726 [Tilletiaria anomala UBC 951]KDN52130.1 hypothetical protein K437DRAFT_232726 [Tilletiaria anomala UBC 951]